MDASETEEITVKKEPNENSNGTPEESGNESQTPTTRCEGASTSIAGPLRYVSRRGRPPGGGYSMKSHAHFVSFSSLPLTTSTDIGRQVSNGSSSSLSPQDLLKSGTSASADKLDIRRFGFSGFDTDKASFRCDGCDVVFSSRDTYAMHMLLRAKNESCVALPTSAISSNPENPTPREKFERELRQHTMATALRTQVTSMSKSATTMASKSDSHSNSLTSLTRSSSLGRDDFSLTGACATDGSFNFSNLFSVDAYGVYLDPRQYRRVIEEYGLRAPSTTSSLQTLMEQLSCTYCGEIFTSKDALAMHMMFHTRDEDKETKTNASWTDMHLATSPKDASNCSSASSSPSQLQGTRRTSKPTETPLIAVKREINKTEERELTAERVAELKRMAIESSLRSPLKKSTSSRQSTRPKSVSQDTPVSTSPQDRPLSADDVRRFTTTDPSSYQLRRESLFTNHTSLNKPGNEAKRGHKRQFTKQEPDPDREVKKLPLDKSKRKRNNYDNIFYNVFCRSKKTITHSHDDSEIEKDPNDSHRPPGTDQPDCDEVSESGSVPDNESSITESENVADYPNTRSIPYLDAIMSHDAVLVPLDQTSDKSEGGSNMEESERRSLDEKVQASALDFSIGSRGGMDHMSRGAWHSTDADHGSDFETQNESTRPQLSTGTNGKTDRNQRCRNLYFQYQNLDRASFSQAGNRGQRVTNRLGSVSRHGLGTGNSHQENGRPSRSWMDESTSRVSEARYCPHCEILFLDVTLFHLHMGLHNVNNPWQCNTCGLVCSGRLDFNTHVLHY